MTTECYLLITSTSCASFSDNVPDAFSWGGGASIAAIFFLFFETKKLPKKPEPESGGRSGLADLGGTADAGRGLPVLGSTCVGFAALCRSLTIAMACTYLSSEGAEYSARTMSYPMTVQKVRMTGIDVTSLHSYQIFH